MRGASTPLAGDRLVESLSAHSVTEVVEVLRSYNSFRIEGTGTRAAFRTVAPTEAVLKIVLRGIVEHDVDDQVVVVRSGTPIAQLQEELAQKGQCLPIGFSKAPFGDAKGTVGGAVSMNLPHAKEAQYGTWRDWVLGMNLVRPDGTVVKCGSKAVKNVAGYDVQRLMVGARGTLGVINEVVLRTMPRNAVELGDPGTEVAPVPAGWIHRVKLSDFEALTASVTAQLIEVFPETGVVIYADDLNLDLPELKEGWRMGWGMGERNLDLTNATLNHLMAKTKSIFDPEHKLNPGEFSFV